MFERYNEAARRVLFFSRYEASQLGSRSIETPHLLLGLIRDTTGFARGLLSTLPLEEIRGTVVEAVPFEEKLATSVEIPFDAGVKRALQYAAAEADALEHPHIGAEHLLLGLLREEGSLAESTLRAYGVNLAAARQQVSGMAPEPAGQPPVQSSASVTRPDAAPGDAMSVQVEQIKQLVRELGLTPANSDASRRLVARIVGMLDELKPPGDPEAA